MRTAFQSHAHGTDGFASVIDTGAGHVVRIEELDTDNGPDGMLMSENARLYARRGIETTIAALRPGGTIAYWSVGDDPKFLHALRVARLEVTTLRVRAHDTAGPMHTLYVAGRRKGDA